MTNLELLLDSLQADWVDMIEYVRNVQVYDTAVCFVGHSYPIADSTLNYVASRVGSIGYEIHCRFCTPAA